MEQVPKSDSTQNADKTVQLALAASLPSQQLCSLQSRKHLSKYINQGTSIIGKESFAWDCHCKFMIILFSVQSLKHLLFAHKFPFCAE